MWLQKLLTLLLGFIMAEEKRVDAFFLRILKKIEIPTAAAIFPAEMSEWPPRSYVDRMFNVTQWTKMLSGGHFAALEEPELLVNDLVKIFRDQFR